MPSYQVKVETVTVGGIDYLIRPLFDIQQYSDPHGEAEQAGISSATWPLFGQLWPSARVLALEMHSFDLKGKRILEIGAGHGVASQVIIVDADRGNRVVFCREMSERGFGFTSRRAKRHIENGEPYKGCFMTFSRSVQETIS